MKVRAPSLSFCVQRFRRTIVKRRRISLDNQRKCRYRDSEKKTQRMALVDRIPVGLSRGKIFSVSMAAMVTLLPECSEKCGGKMVMVAR